MKIYADLNLKKIQNDNNIDFAHFTYLRRQCSCCYGPGDLPARYWLNGVKLPKYIEGTEKYNAAGEIIAGKSRDITYFLFKNADNGFGRVKKNDVIKDHTCISWRLSPQQLQAVCVALQEQLGAEYKVIMPKRDIDCIEIRYLP
jgi:hypothetical protein